jgi:nicotinamide mononucleotide transporter
MILLEEVVMTEKTIVNSKLSVVEKGWLILFTIAITTATLYFSIGSDNIVLDWIISPISAITGIFCVVMAAKGKVSTYLWGIVNSILFAYISFVAGFFGDAILFGVYFLPLQFIGYYVWKRRLKENSTEDVVMKKLTGKQLVIIGILILVFTVLFALFLDQFDGFLSENFQANSDIYENLYETFNFRLLGPLLDSFSVVAQITASMLMLLTFQDQWTVWI